jgi:hypothetical protein
MWRNELDEAEPYLQVAMEISERIGDVERLVPSLNYSTVVYRRLKQVEQV